MKPLLNGASVSHTTSDEQPPTPIFWRMQAPTGRLLTCGLYRTSDGLELRAGYTGDEPLWAEAVPSEEVGLVLAAAWKEVIVGKGGFVDLDPRH